MMNFSWNAKVGAIEEQASIKLTKIVAIPSSLPADVLSDLNKRRQRLDTWRSEIKQKVENFNALGPVESGSAADSLRRRDLEKLVTESNSCSTAVKKFNAEVEAAVAAERSKVSSGQSQRPPYEVDEEGVIPGILAMASKLKWSEDELKRLDLALNSLEEIKSGATKDDIREAWLDIRARLNDAKLGKVASLGSGQGMPAAGSQTNFHDCTIFALANAAGLPYGVVSARATKMIREAEWHTPSSRDDPQRVIEDYGLNGGEIIMLAEAFGQAKVIPRAGFEAALEAGTPVLLNVVPSGGKGGHEVVLTKSFRHDGKTWFEMMDSNHGPLDRLYVTSDELDTIQQENGVVLMRDGETPELLP